MALLKELQKQKEDALHTQYRMERQQLRNDERSAARNVQNQEDIEAAFDIIKEVEGQRAEETAKINQKIDKMNSVRGSKVKESMD